MATAMAGYDGHRGWVNYLAARGCPKLNLQVRDSNTAALGLYATLGYTVDAAVSLGKRLVDDTSTE